MDAEGIVEYASPNGVSAFRRLGDVESLEGRSLAEITTLVDGELQRLCDNGPTEAEMERVTAQAEAHFLYRLQTVGGFGGKAVTLAQGEVLAGDSDFYKRTLANYATVTPAEIRTAMAQWLAKPAFRLRLEPGDRPEYQEAKAVADAKPKGSGKITVSKKREVPSLGSMPALVRKGRNSGTQISTLAVQSSTKPSRNTMTRKNTMVPTTPRPMSEVSA